jgi:hypothetical protein
MLLYCKEFLYLKICDWCKGIRYMICSFSIFSLLKSARFLISQMIVVNSMRLQAVSVASLLITSWLLFFGLLKKKFSAVLNFFLNFFKRVISLKDPG